MLLPEIRPHFDVPLEVSGSTALAGIAEYLGSPDTEIHGWVHAPYAELAIPVADRHWWSPRLALRFKGHDDPGPSSAVVLHCWFQPEPARWTMYIAMWAVLAIVTMIAIAVICVQMILGNAPTVLWALPVAVLIAAGLYGSAVFGQRLGHEQVELLTKQLYRALGDKASVLGQQATDETSD